MPTIGPSPGYAESVGLRWLDRHSAEIQRSLERLSTGKRINRASDDPAGAIAVQNFAAEQSVLERKIASLDFRSLRLSALEGGLSVVSDLMVELQSLVVTAGNRDGLTRSEREGLQIEADSILQTLTHLKQTTTFKGEFLLQGAFNGQTGGVQVVAPQPSTDPDSPAGPPVLQTIGIDGLRRGGRFNLIDGDLENAQKVVDSAVDTIVGNRAAAGAAMKQIDSERDVLAVQLENITASRSAIEDTDYAREVGSLVRSQIMQQAAIFAVMTARNISKQNALALLG